MKTIAITALCATLLGSAALAGNDMDDATLQDAIARFTAAGPQGAQLRLMDVTDFEWDTVRTYHGVTSIELYRFHLGADFRLSDESVQQLMDDSAVLIFLRGDEIVEEVVINPPVWFLGKHLDGSAREPDDAILTVISEDPGPYSAVQFVK